MSTPDTIALLKEALQKSNASPELAKGWLQSGSATTGLTAYDLEAPAKTLYPVITPLRNAIPRTSGKGGIQANWKAVTAININNVSAGVSEGNRGGTIATTVQDYLAAYKGIGLEDFVTFEADYAAETFEDVKARATQGLLRSLMIQEERILLGGNTSVALGTTPTPTLATSASGGTIATSTISVICVALTHEGFLNTTVSSGIPGTAGVVSRTNADASTDSVNAGAATKSANATIAVTGPTGSVTASVASVRGACGYAWFWGAAASETLGAVTNINSVSITTGTGGGQTIANGGPTSDRSRNGLVFDGFLSFAFNSTNNGYYATQATGTAGVGTGLTAGTDGTITEFDAALKFFWDVYRLSPSTIWVSSQEMQFIRKKVLTGSTAAAQRFVFQVQQEGIVGGTGIKGYMNPFTMGEAEQIPIKMHPNLTAGTVLFTTDVLPYPLSGVTNVAQVRTRQDYYSIEWPRKSRKYEYGVYADEVLQVFAPFAFGVITNIAAS